MPQPYMGAELPHTSSGLGVIHLFLLASLVLLEISRKSKTTGKFYSLSTYLVFWGDQGVARIGLESKSHKS